MTYNIFIKLTTLLASLCLVPQLLFAVAPEEMVFPAILEPIERTPIYPEISSLVVAIPKKMGDSFKKGDLLLQLEDEMFVQQVERAKKELERAEVDLSIKRELARDRLLSIPELKEAESAVAKGRAGLAEAQRALKATAVYAGYDGKVANVFIRPHELSIREKIMYEYIDDHVLVAKILIPSKLLKTIHVGSPIYVLVLDLDEIIPARVSRIAAYVEPTSSSVRIEVEIDNSSGHLKSGMTSLASFSKAALEKKEETIETIFDQLHQQESSPKEMEKDDEPNKS